MQTTCILLFLVSVVWVRSCFILPCSSGLFLSSRIMKDRQHYIMVRRPLLFESNKLSHHLFYVGIVVSVCMGLFLLYNWWIFHFFYRENSSFITHWLLFSLRLDSLYTQQLVSWTCPLLPPHLSFSSPSLLHCSSLFSSVFHPVSLIFLHSLCVCVSSGMCVCVPVWLTGFVLCVCV